jgi:hypothetical protein
MEEKLEKLKLKYAEQQKPLIWREDEEVPETLQLTKNQRKKDRIKKVQYVFITFKHCETKKELLKLFKRKKSIVKRFFRICGDLCCGRNIKQDEQEHTRFLFGYPISIEEASEPDQLLWENHYYKKSQIYTRKFLVWLGFSAIFVVVGIILMVLEHGYDNLDRKVPRLDCSHHRPTKLDAYEDFISEGYSFGFMTCYCENEMERGTSIYDFNFTDVARNGEDANYCLRDRDDRFGKWVAQSAIECSPIIFCILLGFVFERFAK